MRVGKMRMMVWLLVVCLKRLQSDWLPPGAGDAHFVTGAGMLAACRGFAGKVINKRVYSKRLAATPIATGTTLINSVGHL